MTVKMKQRIIKFSFVFFVLAGGGGYWFLSQSQDSLIDWKVPWLLHILFSSLKLIIGSRIANEKKTIMNNLYWNNTFLLNFLLPQIFKYIRIIIIIFNNCNYYKITINKRYFKSKVTE